MVLLPLIMAYSKFDDIDLYPFLGLGTTAVAAEQLDRKCIGIEIDKRYSQNSLERLKKDRE